MEGSHIVDVELGDDGLFCLVGVQDKLAFFFCVGGCARFGKGRGLLEVFNELLFLLFANRLFLLSLELIILLLFIKDFLALLGLLL